VALTLSVVVWLGMMTPLLLLALVFANGIGLAMRWPVFAAIVPELVPRAQLPQALALNGVSMNASRIVGPLLAGTLIATAGSAWVFVLNAALACVSAVVIWRWRRPAVPNPLGREPFFSAMRVGWQFVHQSPRLRVVYVHIGLFFFHSTALMALLPLLALALDGGSAETFTILLATMGSGAIVSAMLLPRLRQRLSKDALVWGGSAIMSCAMVVVAWVPVLPGVVPAMFLAGMAWIATANSLSVSAQMSLPDWVRARGMAMYQMALMGSSALGAAWWGLVAGWTSVGLSVTMAALSGLLAVTVAQRVFRESGRADDVATLRPWYAPKPGPTPPPGRVVVCIDYHIDPERADAFRVLMQESRRSRLRMGALDWELWQDIHDAGHFIERITDESWNEHLRRFDRVTAADVALRERKLAFHVGETPPVVTRYVVHTDAGRTSG